MKTILTSKIDKDKVEEIELAFNSSVLIRNRFIEILKDKKENALRAGRSKEAYDCPNWCYKKADEAGYIRAIEEFINILS